MAAIETSLANAFETQLSQNVTASDLTFPVNSIGSLTSPTYLVIDPDNPTKREYVLFDGTFTSTDFVTSNLSKRGLAGSASGAQGHTKGAKVRAVPMQQHFEDLHDRMDTAYTVGGTDVAVADGGTGASTAAVARTNLGAAADAEVVKLTGAQTIAGAKTFSTDPTLADGSSALSLTEGDAAYLGKVAVDVVLDHGAVGDGVTDDTAAIQAAIDSAGTVTAGWAPVLIYLPAGTYRITSTIDILRKGVTLIGAGVGNPTNLSTDPGQGTTVKWDGAAGSPMFRVRDSAHVAFSNFYIQGHGTNSPSEGIFFENDGVNNGQGTNGYMVLDRMRIGHNNRTDADGYAMTYCVRIGGTDGDNDQFYFYNSLFRGATTAQVQIDNPQSIWGSMVSCTFSGADVAKGLVTYASTVLVNPQFTNCTVDIDVNSTAQVDVFGLQSENSLQIGRVRDNYGRLNVVGGVLTLATITSDYFQADSLGNDGALILDGIKVVNQMGTRPGILVRGSATTTTKGEFVVRNCTNIPLSDLDVATGALAGSTVAVTFDSGGVLHRKVLTGNSTALDTSQETFEVKGLSVTQPTKLPLSALYLPGTSGNYVSTPDAAGLDVTGDIDIRIKAALDDWTPAANTALVAKYIFGTNNRSYQLRVNTTGTLSLVWSTDGTSGTVVTATSTVAPTVNDGEFLWVRATLDVDNGASGKDVKFYTSTDGWVWTQLGTTVTTAGTTSIFASTAPLEVGASENGTNTLLAGKVARWTVLSGIEGTPVASGDTTTPDDTFRDGQGNLWTVNGSGWSWKYAA